MQKSNLLSLDSAIEKIRSNFEIVSSEDVFLQNALGRCLSEPIISKINNPRFNVSSMDGYAINYNDYINLKNKNNSKNKEFIQVPLGKIFHIAPSNVDTIFLYSSLIALLCGNICFIRISSNKTAQLDFVIEKLDNGKTGNIFGKSPIASFTVLLFFFFFLFISK